MSYNASSFLVSPTPSLKPPNLWFCTCLNLENISNLNPPSIVYRPRLWCPVQTRNLQRLRNHLIRRGDSRPWEYLHLRLSRLRTRVPTLRLTPDTSVSPCPQVPVTSTGGPQDPLLPRPSDRVVLGPTRMFLNSNLDLPTLRETLFFSYFLLLYFCHSFSWHGTRWEMVLWKVESPTKK